MPLDMMEITKIQSAIRKPKNVYMTPTHPESSKNLDYPTELMVNKYIEDTANKWTKDKRLNDVQRKLMYEQIQTRDLI